MPISYSDVSPLRYPGSKAFLVDYINDLIKENYLEGCNFIEPYAGSSIVSLELLNKGTINQVILVERDPLIYCFWKSVFCYTYELIEKMDRLPITMETWDKFQSFRALDIENESQLNPQLIINLGLAGLFFNRTCFSGILGAGPIGGRKQLSKYKIDCRFNKDTISKKIYDISQLRDSITIYFDDALNFLKRKSRFVKNELCFIYADPPYFSKGKGLYRYWYDYNDHKLLARYLLTLNVPWLVSYDDHEKIREIYKKAPGRWKTYIDYTVSSSSRRKDIELLISNLPIPPESHKLSLIDIS